MTYGFVTWNTCLVFNFSFNVALNLLKYSFLMFFFSLLDIYPLSPKHQGSYTLYPPSSTWPISSPFSNSIAFNFSSLLHSQKTTFIYTKLHTNVLRHDLHCSYKAMEHSIITFAFMGRGCVHQNANWGGGGAHVNANVRL